MKSNLKSLFKYLVALTVFVSLFSCKKTFDIDPGNALDQSQAYRNVYDADAAVLGIYGQFMGLAKQYIVLNELRGDLMDVTDNADQYLREINMHTETAANPYASPLPFYKVIINCNDVLHNFDIMLQNKRMTQEEYDHRYSDIGAIRCWLYLQVGIHWGNVPYVTDPIANIEDLQDPSKFARIPFAELLDKTLLFAESLPYKDAYPTGSSLTNSNDGYAMAKILIPKKLILGDLNLWKQNWSKAAGYYKSIMSSADVIYQNNGSEQMYETYKIAAFTSAAVLNGNWGVMFYGAFNERYSNYENIWVMPFDKNFKPENPFLDMFSTSKSYLFKPSVKAISNWENESNTTNTRIGDSYRANASYRNSLGKLEITKFLGTYSNTLPFETTGKWVLYRAGTLHMRVAEAANRDNRSDLAYALLNTGIKTAYDSPIDLKTLTSGVLRARNVTYIQQSDKDVNSPYYYDGRDADFPVFRAPYYRSAGIRTRVGLSPVLLDSAKYFNIATPTVNVKDANGVITNVIYKPVIDQPALSLFLEDAIMKENSEESAFEGYRWGDLLRIALRRNDPTYLAKAVAAKFPVGSAQYATVYGKLSDANNWYLPFKW